VWEESILREYGVRVGGWLHIDPPLFPELYSQAETPVEPPVFQRKLLDSSFQKLDIFVFIAEFRFEL
jgi:hypothetical protein